jgi:chemotaxis signal transduction protein
MLEKIGSVSGIDAGKVKDYLGFQVKNSVRLVVPADWVVETIALNCHEICPIPGVTDGILGAIDYQGQLVWVIDLGDYLSHLLGLASVPSRDENSLRENKSTHTSTHTSTHELPNKLPNQLTNKLPNQLTNQLTGVAIALPASQSQKSQSQKSINSQPLIWVVSELQGIVSLNSAKFRPLPSQFISLLGAYFSGLTEIDSNSAPTNSTTVAILNIDGLFSALESQSREIAAIWDI